MEAREKLNEFAELRGLKKNKLIGWSIAADFAEWYVEQVKNCSIPAVVGRSEQLCDCDAPLIRTSDKGGEYCGLCQLDLD